MPQVDTEESLQSFCVSAKDKVTKCPICIEKRSCQKKIDLAFKP